MELIVALDVDTASQAERLVNLLEDRVSIFKVGSKLFTAEGPAIIDFINGKGCSVFLDLKYHDIPSVVAGAVKNAAARKVFSVTVHVSGGREMLKTAAALKDRPLIWGVTVLTSLDENNLKEIGVGRKVEEQVVSLAKLAKDAGLDGVVCSPKEIGAVKKVGGLKVIVPGIRPAENEKGDQKRTLTPKEAKNLGADYIVVGRPIIESANPLLAAEKILKDLR